MGKALVVYNTRTGETKAIAELIAEGIRLGGGEAKVANVTEIKKEPDLAGYDGYVFGSGHLPWRDDAGDEDDAFLGRKGRLGGKGSRLIWGLWLEWGGPRTHL